MRRAGWHFSSVLSDEAMQAKISGFADYQGEVIGDCHVD